MRGLVACAFVVAVISVGSALAALPVTVNDPCSTWFGATESESWTAESVTSWVPFGVRCEYPPGARVARENHVPSASSYAAWLVLAAAVFGLAISRWRGAAPRGAACGLVVTALFGMLWVYGETFTAAVIGSCVLGAPIVLALDLRARANLLASVAFSLALPVVVNAAWLVPGLLGVHLVAAACVALVGAVASVAFDRLNLLETTPSGAIGS